MVGCLAACLAVPLPGWTQPADIPLRLTLSEALRLAMERNPSLDVARKELAVADTGILSAQQRPNPVASFSSEGYNGDPAGAGFFNKQELFFQVTQEFELGGQRRLRTAGARSAVDAQHAALDDRVRQLRLDVQRAYLQLALAREEGAAARTTLDEVDKVIALNRSRFKQGEISGGELRRLEVERLKFTDDQLNADLAQRNARSALLALMGSPRLDLQIEAIDGLGAGDRPGAASDAKAPSPSAGLDLATAFASALSGRPDILSARAEQQRARTELDLQKAERTPSLTVGAGVKRDFGANGLLWSAEMPLPLFNHNAGGIARADAEGRLADSRLRELESRVSLEVQQAANLVDVARQRVTYLENDYLTRAKEARDAVLSAYRLGEGALLDYLDAQRAYRDVQRAYNRALFEYRLSRFQFDAVIGIGGSHS